MQDRSAFHTNKLLARIGTAAWALPAPVRNRFPAGASNLARYAGRFNCTEINSTFYRAHQPATFTRWAESVPDEFRFAVKLPQAITHEARLVRCVPLLRDCLLQAGHLGEKLGCLLIQLPGSFAFDKSVEKFFAELRARHEGAVVIEPRNASWFQPDGDRLLQKYAINRVVADPARVAAAALPGGATDLVYIRLHGSPRIYWSSYTETQLTDLARRIDRLIAKNVPVWCIFDNTASGAATANALRCAAMCCARLTE